MRNVNTIKSLNARTNFLVFYINYEECKFIQNTINTYEDKRFILTMRNVNYNIDKLQQFKYEVLY